MLILNNEPPDLCLNLAKICKLAAKRKEPVCEIFFEAESEWILYEAGDAHVTLVGHLRIAK